MPTATATITLTPGQHTLRFDLPGGWLALQPVVVRGGAAVGEGAAAGDGLACSVALAVRTGERATAIEGGAQEWLAVPPLGNTFSDATGEPAAAGDARDAVANFVVATGEAARPADGLGLGLARNVTSSEGAAAGDAVDSSHVPADVFLEVTSPGDEYASAVSFAVRIGEGVRALDHDNDIYPATSLVADHGATAKVGVPFSLLFTLSNDTARTMKLVGCTTYCEPSAAAGDIDDPEFAPWKSTIHPGDTLTDRLWGIMYCPGTYTIWVVTTLRGHVSVETAPITLTVSP